MNKPSSKGLEIQPLADPQVAGLFFVRKPLLIVAGLLLLLSGLAGVVGWGIQLDRQIKLAVEELVPCAGHRGVCVMLRRENDYQQLLATGQRVQLKVPTGEPYQFVVLKGSVLALDSQRVIAELTSPAPSFPPEFALVTVGREPLFTNLWRDLFSSR